MPIPHIKLRDKRLAVRRPCKWKVFLTSLVPGDSFVVEWPECSSVRHWSKALDIGLAWVPIREHGPNGRPQERYWRVDRELLAKYQSSDPFHEQGRQAFYEHVDRTDCPYEEGTDGQCGWLKGYDAATAFESELQHGRAD